MIVEFNDSVKRALQKIDEKCGVVIENGKLVYKTSLKPVKKAADREKIDTIFEMIAECHLSDIEELLAQRQRDEARASGTVAPLKEIKICDGRLDRAMVNAEDIRLMQDIRIPYARTNEIAATEAREPEIIIELDGTTARRVSTQCRCGGLSESVRKRYTDLWLEYIHNANTAIKELAQQYPDQAVHKPMADWLLKHVPACMIGPKMTMICTGSKDCWVPEEITGWVDPLKDFEKDGDVLLSAKELKIYNVQPLSNRKDEIALRHIILEELPTGDTPTWDEMALKYTPEEWKVLCAYIYSIFDMKNRSRQGCYIYDNGHSGKSCLFRTLQWAIGDDLVCSPDPVGRKDEDKFFSSQFYGKRLCLIPDNKNPMIFEYQWIHNVTGGDPMEIEYKNRDSFCARVYCKVLIGSNTIPQFNKGAEHIKSRVIILRPKIEGEALERLAQRDSNGEMVKDQYGRVMLKEDPHFECGLREEFWCFLKKCEKAYKELCRDGADIRLPESVRSSIDLGQSLKAEAIECALHESLTIDPAGEIASGKLTEILKSIAEDVTYKLFGASPTSKDIITGSQILSYLCENFGVCKGNGRKRLGGNPTYFYTGVRESGVEELADHILGDDDTIDLSDI